MRIAVLSFGVLILLSLSPLADRVAAQPGCGYPDVNTEGAIVLIGVSKLNTKPFDLDAVPYTVRWAGSAPDKLAPGNLIMTMKRADGQFFSELLVNTVVNRGDPEASGETQVYLAKAGKYYLEVSAPAGWTVTVTRQI